MCMANITMVTDKQIAFYSVLITYFLYFKHKIAWNLLHHDLEMIHDEFVKIRLEPETFMNTLCGLSWTSTYMDRFQY